MNLEEQMFSLVEEFLKSGKTQREYSKDQGIGRAKFNYWVCKYKTRHRQSSAGFIKVETVPASQDQNLDILYPNGVRLKISASELFLISQLIRLY